MHLGGTDRGEEPPAALNPAAQPVLISSAD
jgi:hypothetical protein